MERSEQNLYSSLSESEREHIHENARKLAGLLSIWCSCYPIIRPKRIEPVAVLVATVLPELDMQQQLLASKIILYIFAIDDLADERLVSYQTFRRKSSLWAEILRTGQITPEEMHEDLSEILHEVYHEISQFPLFSNLHHLWLARFDGLTEGMAHEYADGLRYSIGGKETLPPLREYIEGGILSAGTPWWSTSVLIMLSEPAILPQLSKINAAIRNTGAAIRLFNDLRTLQKEIDETNINSIIIVQQTLQSNNKFLTADSALQQAQDIIHGLADQYARKSENLVRQIQTDSGKFECMILRLIAFHAYFYGSRQHAMDYHTLSQSDSFLLIQRDLHANRTCEEAND